MQIPERIRRKAHFPTPALHSVGVGQKEYFIRSDHPSLAHVGTKPRRAFSGYRSADSDDENIFFTVYVTNRKILGLAEKQTWSDGLRSRPEQG